MGLNQYYSTSSVLTKLNLIGDDQVANDFMSVLLDGISNGFANRIECFNDYGKQSVLFLYVVEPIIDFPAFSDWNIQWGVRRLSFSSVFVFHTWKEFSAATIVHTSNFQARRMYMIRLDARMNIFEMLVFFLNQYVSIWY